MIFLDEEYIFHNGIMVLPDYSNERQFYFLPPPPKLVEDLETNRKVFKILKLAGGLTDPTEPEASRTGVVFFDCDLHLSTTEQNELKEAVQSQLGITEEINLTPLLYKDGEVNCYILGEQDWEEEETIVESGTKSNIFVEKLAGFGKPSLYGNNRASFSAKMTQEGISALEASFATGGAIGISIVYSLKFDALRPAFKFKVKADWERIYHFLEESYKFDLWFFSYEDTNIIEQLEEERLVSFEEVVYEEGAKGEVRELRKQLQKFILEKFFEPVLSIGDPAHNQVPGLVQDILRATVLTPTVGYKRIEVTQEERKSFSFDVSQTTAIEQVIYPQAHLTTLIPPEEISNYVQEINTDQDLFFRQLSVDCSLGGADFEKHQISWVHPFIRYGDQPEEGTDKTFTDLNERMQFTTWLQPNHGFNYRTWYEVHFNQADETDPDTIYGKDISFTSSEQRQNDRALILNPIEHFELRTVEFGLMAGFPTEQYPLVEINLKYENAEGYRVEPTYKLSADQNSGLFRVRQHPDAIDTTQYRITFYPSQGPSFSKDWEIVDGSSVLIDDPFPSRFTVRVGIAESPTNLAWADVVLKYEDLDHPATAQEERFFFTDSDLETADLRTRLWTIRTLNPNHQRYQYTFTIFYQDGTELISPDWIESDSKTLIIGRRARMWRTVDVAPSGPTFAAEKLRDIKVVLTYAESEEAEPQISEFLFESEDDSNEFTYQVRNPIKIGYGYEVLYRWLNGRVKKVQGNANAGSLTLNIPTKID
ncbi:MAG: hypothetical protein AAF696_26455 [Bacteroidota bacterium]